MQLNELDPQSCDWSEYVYAFTLLLFYLDKVHILIEDLDLHT